MVVDNSPNRAVPGRMWRAATHTRLLVGSGIISLVAGTLGGIAWIMTHRYFWNARSGTLSFGEVERYVISALLLVAGVVVAISVFRMGRDTARIGRVQTIVYWVATAVLWVLVFGTLTTSVDIRAGGLGLNL